MIKSMSSKQLYEHIVIFVECINKEYDSIQKSVNIYQKFKENSTGLEGVYDFIRGVYYKHKGVKNYKKYSIGMYDNAKLKTSIFIGKSLIGINRVKYEIDNSFGKLNELMYLHPNNKEEIHRALVKFIIDYGVLKEELTDWQDRKIIKEILNTI